MQPLDIGVCLNKSIVALESIGHLCPANMVTNRNRHIPEWLTWLRNNGHFLAGTDMAARFSENFGSIFRQMRPPTTGQASRSHRWLE